MLSFVDEMTLLLCFAFEAGVCGAMGQGHLSALWDTRLGLPACHRCGEMNLVRAFFSLEPSRSGRSVRLLTR